MDTKLLAAGGRLAALPSLDRDTSAPQSIAAPLYADLIVSLPQTALDALMPEAPPAQVQENFSPGSLSLELRLSVTPRALFDTVGDAKQNITWEQPHGLKDASIGGTHGSDSNVAIGAEATTRNLLVRAREAGLSEAEVQRLELILRNGGHTATDTRLVADLLDTANAARGLRTFMELDPLRKQHPDRITPRMVEELSMGVGRARAGSSEGSEGVLSQATAITAAKALIEMRPADFREIEARVMYAGLQFQLQPIDRDTQCALILKAVAARRDELRNYDAVDVFVGARSKACREIAAFAGAMYGRDAQTLAQLTSGVDVDGDGIDEAIQRDPNASAQAVQQMARAEVDPIYAWNLHFGVVPELPAGDGTVVDAMNGARSPSTGAAYQHHTVGDSDAERGAALDQIEKLIISGVDVPIAVSNGGESRALLITDVRGSGDTRQFLVTDPSTGHTEWRPANEITSGGEALTDYWS